MTLTHHVLHSSIKSHGRPVIPTDDNTKVWLTTRKARGNDEHTSCLVDTDEDDDLNLGWNISDWDSDGMCAEILFEYCTPLAEALFKLSGNCNCEDDDVEDDKPTVIIHMSKEYMSKNFSELVSLGLICDVQLW